MMPTKSTTWVSESTPNIITNMMMERLASTNGPTKGQILRPSDNKAPESVAFVQCAGSGMKTICLIVPIFAAWLH